MPVLDIRTVNSTRKGRRTTGGHYTVIYRKPTGLTVSAVVLGAGTSSGLKLQVSGRGAGNNVIDNVAVATTRAQTGVYFTRGGPSY
jgi:hypothetical protein